jgi:multidrug efflux pump
MQRAPLSRPTRLTTKRIEERLLQEAGRVQRQHLGGLGCAALLPASGQHFPQSNVSQFIIVPKELKLREPLRIKLPALIAQEFPEVRARVKILPNGPPVAYPVQFRVLGPEPCVAAGTR